MNGPRRRLLAVSGSVVASLAGCLGRVPDDPGDALETSGDDRTAPADPTAPADRTATTDRTAPADRTATDAPNYPGTVEVTTTVTRDDVTYVAGNDTVRYVAAYGSKDSAGDDETPPEREPIYEYVSFEEWAETECASVGAGRVYEVVTERLDGATEGISTGVTSEDGGLAVLVVHRTVLDRDGAVVSEPTVRYERVERIAPERVAVTLTLDGRTHSCTVPVTTRETEIKQQ